MWDNVYKIIQGIESQIDCIYHTTDLYNSFSRYIRELVQIKKPVGVWYGFKLHNFPNNERFSKLQVCRQYILPNHKLIFPPFSNTFLPSSKNIILKGSPIQSDICDCNHRCLMSSGFIFDYIIMNIFRNKGLEFHGEKVDSYFTKT